ncbi:glycerate kinase [Mumia sp. zg.B53]|uniref:glycerate kinase family protein n=1 Tax=Mumia sp. zg.B53 TaxID=2855449 RepID=UPI001C6F302C|nr:glycerate kinase [Mumia sp. zg.B53]MBW9216580.1 glycerate kinase [Mumia sp. zg.B53]
MRVLVAPDAFAGTLTAPEAAEAIAEGWLRTAPDDVMTLVPMSDGGPGFVDVLHASLGGERLLVSGVRGPLGALVEAPLLLVDGLDGRSTAYVESATACGLEADPRRSPEDASTYGVGQLVTAAVDAGAARVVVGLGGSATTDGGAGMLAALGARADVPLDAGPRGLTGVGQVDVTGASERLGDVELVAATDVRNPLLGLLGAARTFGPQKGLDDAAVIRVDGILDAFVVAVCGPGPAQRRVADRPGAGAAGGLGFALQLLGATVEPGIGMVAQAVGLADRARESDLVLTGEGAFDVTSREGKVVYGVAEIAGGALRPCVVLAGRVEVGARERRAMGIEAAYAMVDVVGEVDSLGRPAESLRRLAERVARTWSDR